MESIEVEADRVLEKELWLRIYKVTPGLVAGSLKRALASQHMESTAHGSPRSTGIKHLPVFHGYWQ